jgi:hypothetical protein
MEPTAAAEAHAARVVAGDAAIRTVLMPEAPIEPGDLYDRLLAGPFRRFELVAHARVGAHHIFKTRYVGPTTLVVQERWVRGNDGTWRIHEAELARVATEDEG